MDCEVLAIGTELLLGDVVDTNSSWIGQRLAEAGIACYFQGKVGDNHARIVAALRSALLRSDAVICSGGLGPTQDDITREAIAEVMGVSLVRDPAIEAWLAERFRGREVPASNFKQADVPEGATPLLGALGTAPGLICPLEDRVIYAVAGVPAEMRDLVANVIVPDLLRRSRERSGEIATVQSRFLRVWGVPESKVAEIVAPRLVALEGTGTTIAFLANVTEGVRVRVTTRAVGASPEEAEAAAELALRNEEAELRALLGESVGGVDDESLEVVVGQSLVARGLKLAVAESLTGGLVASRLSSVPGASEWFIGGVVSYSDEVKRGLLGVGPGPVVSELAAKEMALGAARALKADIGLSLTGVAGPTMQEEQPIGTVWVALTGAQGASATRLTLSGTRDLIRQRATTYALDLLRRSLVAQFAPAHKT
ncbi:MAG TPA: CinA family nicotinamide mononucleotide deamidase-related protein [Acidimicrobiales bacterium]|nr:CinA family nicotinamide mononucleotide deamidase-related protein [Acidimicrobiales bacterium]